MTLVEGDESTPGNKDGSDLKFEGPLKIVGSIIAIATFAFGLYQFGANQSLAQEAAQRESKKPFLERQLQLYFDTANTVSNLANVAPKNEDKRLIAHFWELYWGPLSLVEDLQVDDAVADYGFLLKLYIDRRPLSQRCLRQAALQVTHSMARSLETGWNQKGDLTYIVDMSPCPHRRK